MGLYLINFARGDDYKRIQEKQYNTLRYYFRDIFQYDDQFLINSGYYERNKETIDKSTTGWGYCGWKGEIFLDAMSKVEDDDLIFYSDVSDEIYNPEFYQWMVNRTNQMNGKFFNLNYYINCNWTKRDCFIDMGCDEEKYWNHRQLEAGTIGLLKQPDNLEFLNLWSQWCQVAHIIDKTPSTKGEEIAGFVDHRCDQSILTNLVIDKGWETEYMENIRGYIRYNSFDSNLSPWKHLGK